MASVDSDVLARLVQESLGPTQGHLESIDKSLKELQGFIQNGSQSSVSDAIRNATSNRMRNNYNDYSSSRSGSGQSRSYGSFEDEFTKAIKDGLLKNVFNDATSKKIQDAVVKAFGENLNLKDIPGRIGKEIGQRILRSSGVESGLGEVGAVFDKALTGFNATLDASGSLTQALSRGAQIVGNNAGQLASGLGEVVTKLGPLALAGAAVIYKLNELEEAIQPAIEGFQEYNKALDAASKRQQNSARENSKLAKDRLLADVRTLVSEPFKILEESANSLTQAFDSNLRIISATQGYTKSDVQDLMSAYAQRLRDEGLTDIISGSSLVDNLSKVISSGLSGRVAEEFAYQATILGNAIPTQDFFGYASTYSSIAANAIRLGKSQDEAIQEANDSLLTFANNLLYAGRQLAGGYSTGLTNAQSIYEQSVRIAQAARSGNISGISGVMTSVAAIVGAVAPDLANAITDAVYSAATGGNASSTVALRSLAGINASNTEFLQALASDPQKVFSTLFTNLASMYNDSSAAYMEKAEGYAELFGLSSDAFARIDFNYLAQAISQMNTNSDALNENMELMVSGETTLTAEQLKNRQINQYMIENGLSYVLDNEAAREIQKHMWDEQLAREMMEAEYGVNLQGAALDALLGILSAIQNIIIWLIPGMEGITESIEQLSTFAEAEAWKSDIRQVLELGNVGSANRTTLSNLLTRDANLNLTSSLVSQLGGRSNYGIMQFGRRYLSGGNINTGISLLSRIGDLDDYVDAAVIGSISGAVSSMLGRSRSTNVSSGYSWNILGKSSQSVISSLLGGSDYNFAQVATHSTSSSNRTSSLLYDLISSSKSYTDFASKARKHGIVNLSDALESAGYDESALGRYFESKQAQVAAQEAEQYRQVEREFYSLGVDFYKLQFPENFQTPLFDTLNSMVERWDEWRENWDKHQSTMKKYVTDWSNYYINHVYYDQALGGESYYKKVAEIQRQEQTQKGDAIYALAEALTANTADLKDPTLQTNALLSQILVVINAIQNQTNNAGASSGLADTLAALAMGGTYKV